MSSKPFLIGRAEVMSSCSSGPQDVPGEFVMHLRGEHRKVPAEVIRSWMQHCTKVRGALR